MPFYLYLSAYKEQMTSLDTTSSLFANNRFAIRVKQRRERLSLTQEAPQLFMDHAAHNKIVSFIWGIADNVLHSVEPQVKHSTTLRSLHFATSRPVLTNSNSELILRPTSMASHRMCKKLNERVEGARDQKRKQKCA